MADKKMTDLDPLNNGTAAEDILHVVDDPDNNPVNKKVTVEAFIGNINKTTSSTDASGKSLAKSTLTVGASTSDYAEVMTPLETSIVHSAGSQATKGVYGAKIVSKVGAAVSNVTTSGELAGAYIEQDITGAANTTSLVGGKYGLVVKINDSSSNRVVRPDAMIKLTDTKSVGGSAGENASDGTYTTPYLFDLGNVHVTTNGNFWSDGANNAMVFRSSNGYVTGTQLTASRLRVKVNGEDWFLLATSNGYTQDSQ